MAESIQSAYSRPGLTGSMTLLRELQHAFYEIARQAELGGKTSNSAVQLRAEQALRLIDSCLITSQVESGQTKLDLSPYGVGSVMHESAYELRIATGQKVGISTGVNHPVMTNAELLKNFLYSAGNFIHEAAKKPLTLRSFADKTGAVGVGVFSDDFGITPDELRHGLAICESAQMPIAQYSQTSGAMLLLADALAHTLGGGLQVKKLGRQKGFATILPISRQLSLVAG